jgi:hypothetical protein
VLAEIRTCVCGRPPISVDREAGKIASRGFARSGEQVSVGSFQGACSPPYFSLSGSELRSILIDLGSDPVVAERALAARPAVNTAHMPSPSTRASIAAVSAVSACMPSVRTRETIAVLPRRSRPLSPDRAQPFPIHRATFRRSTHFRLSSEGSTNAHEQVN